MITGTDIHDIRRQTQAMLVETVAHLRKKGFSGDVHYNDKQIIKTFESVFGNVKSDEDLACFIAIFVGAWIERTGITNEILESITLVAETVKAKA